MPPRDWHQFVDKKQLHVSRYKYKVNKKNRI